MQIQSAVLLNVDAAADVVPAAGKIRTGYLRGFKGLVRDLGGDPIQILERHDLDPLAFESHDYDIGCATAVDLYEYCSRTLNAPVFGLHLAEQQEIGRASCRERVCQYV